MNHRIIQTEGRSYFRNPSVDRYQIPIGELGDLRIIDIPAHSHVEILDIPRPGGGSSELYFVNSGEDLDDESVSIYGGATIPCTSLHEAGRIAARLRRILPYDLQRVGPLQNPTISESAVHTYVGFNLTGRGSETLSSVVAPIAAMLAKMEGPSATVFLCHASEDKSIARQLSTRLKDIGADVWLDELEIRVGDSIVELINQGLRKATHLIILLSSNSVNKPWVVRELSSTLMRQLSKDSITILPVRLDDCEVPPLLADLRYASYRRGLSRTVQELREALFPPV